MITLQKKQALIDSAKQHQKPDESQTGIYSKNRGGNAVGCAIADINRLENLDIDRYNHTALAEYLDIPVFLTKMQDDVFEKCTDDYRKNWPIKFLEAIPTDRTISDLIVPKFLLFVLKDFDCPDAKDVLTNWIETGKSDKEAASAAWRTARAAYDSYAAYAAVDAAAGRAAYTAAYAANAAWYAASATSHATAYAAADAAAIDSVRTYDLYGEELLRLMEETDHSYIEYNNELPLKKEYSFDTYINHMGVEVEANTGIPADQYKPFSIKNTL